MQILEAEFGGALPIDGYGPGFFRVAGKVLQGPVVVHSAAAGPWGGYEDIDSLRPLAGLVDVLFIGTGAEIAFPPKEFLRVLEEDLGLMCEAMASPAAARSYNVLLTEGRRVAVALLPVPATPAS